MRNNGLAIIRKDTRLPYKGTGIYFQNKTFSFDSSSFHVQTIFIKFQHVKLLLSMRQKYRKQLRENKGQYWMEKTMTENIQYTNDHINLLLNHIRNTLSKNI